MIVETRYKKVDDLPMGHVYNLNGVHYLNGRDESYCLSTGQKAMITGDQLVEDLGRIEGRITLFGELEVGELYNGSTLKTDDGAIDLMTGQHRVPMATTHCYRVGRKLVISEGVKLESSSPKDNTV